MDALNIRDRAASGTSAVVAYIEKCISDGTLGPGAKLPTERELEKRFGVSRNTLRKSLRQLEEQGKIVRQVGRGSFVAGKEAQPDLPDVSFALGLGEVIRRIQGASPAEVMEVRLIIEPLAAELAAGRANLEELRKMEQCLVNAGQAPDIPTFEHWDGMLHGTIMAAAKNGLLTAVYDLINSVRNQPEWARLKARSVTPERRACYQEQHSRIVAALKDRDSDLARQELQKHLLQVRANLLAL
ncbi:FadR/GntR family transcriptional regulator [Telmatospirillum sp. J64-1]|uniref:FadR/GntR family transcriptional regulator n=1 Tax=Telmatospirillum sp. J64-1 TaxID=2502183 RepID=UPI0021020C22|nr:FCD domain-containing protein [Telmatospirillum sp. J64-1]